MMNRFFTLLFVASCFTAVGQVPDYVPSDGLVAWWAFNGSVDEALIGLTSGSQVTFGEDRFGVENHALDMFNSPAPYIDYGGEISELGQLQSITISLWSKLEDASAYNHFIQHRTSDVNFSFVVSNNNTGFYAYHGTSNDSLLQTSTLPTTDQWFMLTWTLECNSDSVRSSMFLNGASIGQNSFGSGCLYSLPTDVLKVGGGAANLENKVKGSIDDLGIWERALSEEEIFEFYSTAKPVTGCLDELACNFKSDAQLDDGSCHFLCEYCKEGTVWDEAVQGCIVANPSDSNFDGCVQLNDLLDLLSAYGDCGSEELAWQCGDPLDYQGYDYETVQIGEQCWFAENLRASYFQNGELIPQNLTQDEWTSSAEPACAVYGELDSPCQQEMTSVPYCSIPDASLIDFGRLYRGTAVMDNRGLCPSGWSVPSDSDFLELEIHAGMEEVEASNTGWRGDGVANVLKSNSGWYEAGNGINSLSFDSRPAGYRGGSGHRNAGGLSYFWTSSEEDSMLWRRVLSWHEAGVLRDLFGSIDGFSVRCIKD